MSCSEVYGNFRFTIPFETVVDRNKIIGIVQAEHLKEIFPYRVSSWPPVQICDNMQIPGEITVYSDTDAVDDDEYEVRLKHVYVALEDSGFHISRSDLQIERDFEPYLGQFDYAGNLVWFPLKRFAIFTMDRAEELCRLGEFVNRKAPDIPLVKYMTGLVDQLVSAAKEYSRSEVAGPDPAALKKLQQAEEAILAPFTP